MFVGRFCPIVPAFGVTPPLQLAGWPVPVPVAAPVLVLFGIIFFGSVLGATELDSEAQPAATTMATKRANRLPRFITLPP